MRGTTRVRRALVVAVALLGLTGCGALGGGEEQAPAKKKSAATEQRPVAEKKPRAAYRVGIDTPFHPLFEIVAAEKKDLFGKQPYTVGFSALPEDQLVPAFASGKVQVIGALTGHLPSLRKAVGEPVQMFLPLGRMGTGSAVVVPVDSKARTVADLRGKKLAAPDLAGVQAEEVAAVEAAVDGRIDTYFRLLTSPAPLRSLSNGEVQAALVDPGTARTLAQSTEFRILLQTGEVLQQALGDDRVLSAGLVARKSFLDRNPEFAADLAAAFQRAWAAYVAKTGPVLGAIRTKTAIGPEQLAKVLAVLNLETTPPAFRAVTRRDAASWETLFAIVAANGHLNGEVGKANEFFRVIRQ